MAKGIYSSGNDYQMNAGSKKHSKKRENALSLKRWIMNCCNNILNLLVDKIVILL